MPPPNASVAEFPGTGARPPPIAMQCGNCSFWMLAPPEMQNAANLKAPRNGWCRRYPPMLHAVGPAVDERGQVVKGPHGGAMPNLQPTRPPTLEGDWCGEFQIALIRTAPARNG